MDGGWRMEGWRVEGVEGVQGKGRVVGGVLRVDNAYWVEDQGMEGGRVEMKVGGCIVGGGYGGMEGGEWSGWRWRVERWKVDG